jgi:hypothetical protein
MFSTGGNTFIVSAPDAIPGSTPVGVTQLITQPTLTISGTPVATGVISVSVNGVTVLYAVPATPSLDGVGAALAAAINTAAINGVGTATYAAGVITVTGAQTLVYGAGTSGVVGVTVNEIITTSDTNAIVQLTNVTGMTGFGALHTVNSVDTVDSVTNIIAPALTNTGSASAVTESATGYSSLNSTSIGTLGTTSTAITGLASNAKVDFSGYTGDIKSVSITQAGGAGNNALGITLAGTQTAGTLTLNGDWLATLTGATGGSILTSLVDGGGALATLSEIDFLGANAVTVSGITDSALTKIDASAATGNLSLGITGGVAIPNSGLTVVLEKTTSASETLNFAGNNVTFTQASGVNSSTLVLNAFGANDVISLTTAAGSNQTSTIQAGGIGDTFTINNGAGGTAVIGGVISAGVASAATAADTFTFIGTGTDTAWVGAGSTVNLGGLVSGTFTNFTGTANIKVAGDAYAGGAGLVTVNGDPITGTNHLNINFGTGATAATAAPSSSMANSQVNVSSAISLANALDIAAGFAATAQAASQGNLNKIAAGAGLIDWFQYNGDTYIVEAINPGSAAATHTALAATDVVVKLTGLVDLSGATFGVVANSVHY